MITISQKQVSKTSIFELSGLKKLHKQVVHPSLGRPAPPPPDLIPKSGEKHVNTAQNMLSIAWMVILGGHNIKKTSFENFDF